MILITGDIHGYWHYLNVLITRRRPSMVLNVGDFGWWPGMEVSTNRHYGIKEQWILKGLKVPAFCKGVWWCDGNHEDHEDLRDIQFEGKPTLMYNRVTFMPRGSTLTLPDGRIVLFVGGADSIDKHSRTEGFDWFRDEIINYREFNRAMEHDRVDIVISHTCPEEFIQKGDYFGKEGDPCCKALSSILWKYKPDLWYYGHWHLYAEGKYNNTHWTALHMAPRDKWWVQLPEV